MRLNFSQCVADICTLIEQVGRGNISVEGAKLTAIGTIAEYSDSRYEAFARLPERAAQGDADVTKTA